MFDSHLQEFHHEIRQSSFILILRIFLAEVIIIFLHFITGKLFIGFNLHDMSGFGLSIMTWETIIFHTINIIVIFTVIRIWTNTSYTLTPWTVTITSGILYKSRTSYNFGHIESANVKQGILGRIFDYGTVQIKSPYFDKDISLSRIPSPNHLVEAMERQRLFDDLPDNKEGDITYFSKT